MSKIDLVEHATPAIVLMNAICAKYAGEYQTMSDELKLNGGSVVEVKLTVNGVEIPFEQTAEDLWRQVNDEVNARALEMAKEIISGAKLQKVFEAVEKAEWEINQALEQALSHIKG